MEQAGISKDRAKWQQHTMAIPNEIDGPHSIEDLREPWSPWTTGERSWGRRYSKRRPNREKWSQGKGRKGRNRNVAGEKKQYFRDWSVQQREAMRCNSVGDAQVLNSTTTDRFWSGSRDKETHNIAGCKTWRTRTLLLDEEERKRGHVVDLMNRLK